MKIDLEIPKVIFSNNEKPQFNIDMFTMDELDTVLNKLNSNAAADKDGIIGSFLKIDC